MKYSRNTKFFTIFFKKNLFFFHNFFFVTNKKFDYLKTAQKHIFICSYCSESVLLAIHISTAIFTLNLNRKSYLTIFRNFSPTTPQKTYRKFQISKYFRFSPAFLLADFLTIKDGLLQLCKHYVENTVAILQPSSLYHILSIL